MAIGFKQMLRTLVTERVQGAFPNTLPPRALARLCGAPFVEQASMRYVHQSDAVIMDCASSRLSVTRMELFMMGVLTAFPGFLLENG